jgi:hypothetical protein
MKERLTDGRTPDAKLAHQLAFGGEVAARRKLSITNALFHALGYVLKQLTAANGGQNGIPVIPLGRAY